MNSPHEKQVDPADKREFAVTLDDIEVVNRLRSITQTTVDALAIDIGERGQRVAIEIARNKRRGAKKPWRLVAGLHRIAAHQKLGWETIRAVEVTGSEDKLRLDEILENLTRSELTKLERAVHLAALKALHQKMNPTAKNGGDPKLRDQNANLANWYQAVAAASERSLRTIQREASIGEGLSPQTVTALKGTALEDNQAELEALSALGPEMQASVLSVLHSEDPPATSVRGAVAFVEGRASPKDRSEGDAKLGKLIDAWARAGEATRAAFLKEIGAELIKGGE
jgi:ParB family transcriptional regulator, chromosome partitioning protein